MKDLIERQAAIDAMCSACGYDCDKSEFVYNAPQDKQVIMCPEHYALTVLPPAQSDVSSTNVGDTISRQDAIDVAFDIFPDDEYFREQFVKGIAALPPAQSEIIHCEHCRHGVHSGRGDTYLCVVSPEELSEHKYDFFCGYGERRED